MAEQKKKILIGEDEKPMAKALQLKLTHAGFEALAVFNGEEVIEQLAKEQYDLILLDLIMPIKDGFTVLKELKEKGNTVPIIVTSNLSQEEDAKRAKELDAVDYLIKSNTPLAAIVEKVKTILGG
jgi:DNA-binding response OmpR family regulator